jgi:membrane protein DedA with SNARE-associated domain
MLQMLWRTVRVALAMAIESARIPLPSEVMMRFAGYVAWEGKLSLLGVAIAGTIGCLAGSLVVYSIGAYGGRPLLERCGRHILVRTSELDRADTWFARHGEITALISRVLPTIRSFISLPAGIARMDIKKFSLYTTLGSFPWCFALAYVGFFAEPAVGDHRTALPTSRHRRDRGFVALVGYLIYHRKRIAARMRES